MLPAAAPDAPSLADVLESCLDVVLGRAARIPLPSVDRAVVVLVDGLGVEGLRARSGHARTLASAPTSELAAGFPTTTAVALASLTTGALPGRHGIVGYSALDRARDRVLNQLTGWGPLMDPLTWQPLPTVFERAVNEGVDAVAIGPERYRDSGFTRAVLRGARYLAGASIGERAARARDWLARAGRGVAYLYIPELDVAAHARGWQSGEWTGALEEADAAIREIAAALGPRDGMVVTADHGVVDVPADVQVLVDRIPGLLDGVRHVAGEPRGLQLHVEDGVDAADVAARWRDREGGRSWVVSRDEVIGAGWFGEASADARSRMGDVFVVAREPIAYYDSRTAGASRLMVGQHGSLSPAELVVPLARFGAFA